MFLTVLRPRIGVVLWLLAVLATTVIVHLVTILALPLEAKDDAFARIAALGPANTKILLKPATNAGDRIPRRDPAMATAICRFDLAAAPLRLAIEPFDRGFVAIGVHSRRGVAFYGMNVMALELSRIDLVLMTAAQKEAAETKSEDDEQEGHDLRVIAPGPEGFITVETPAGEAGSGLGAAVLDHVVCGSDTGG